MPFFVGLIAPGFIEDTKKIELATNLTRITFPFLMFVSLSSFFGAILNSHNKFAAAAAAPIILNLILIGILFFGKFLNDNLVYYLSYGVSIAGFLQLVFLYKFVKKFYLININFKFKINKDVKLFFKKLLTKHIFFWCYPNKYTSWHNYCFFSSKCCILFILCR